MHPDARAQMTPEAAKGYTWLLAQVEPSGALRGAAGSVATRTQAESETAASLAVSALGSAALIDHIASGPGDNTEYLSRKIEALRSASRDIAALSTDLLARQNRDGGFGGAAGYQSNPLDSAFALAALTGSAEHAPAVRSVSEYLLGIQDVNGSFSLDRRTPNIYLTARVSAALQAHLASPDVQTAVARANAWLASVQGADGSWGGVADTSLVQLALVGTSSDAVMLGLATRFILSGQAEDGSWNADPYITALALRALRAHQAATAHTGTLRGQVLDDTTSLPLAGASITIPELQASAVTDSAGNFTLPGLQPGTHAATASAPGYATRTFTLEVRAGITTVVNGVRLAPAMNTGSLAGIIVSGTTGSPLAGALVKVNGAATGSVYSGADGRYELGGLAAGAVQVEASKAGFQSVHAQTTIVAGVKFEFNPVLNSAPTTASISGLLVDGATGLPLAGATLNIAQLGMTTITGADGRFNFAGIASGLVTVTFSMDGYQARSFTVVIEPGVSVDVQSVALVKTGTPQTHATISGRITAKATGEPLAGVAVVVSGSTSGSATTGADGSYQLDHIAPGSVVITAAKEGYVLASASATVAAAQTVVFSPPMELTVTPGVSGRIVDIATLDPVAGASATIDGIRQATDASGRFVFTTIADGNHGIRLEADGYVTRLLPLFTDGVNPVAMGDLKLARTSVPVTVRGRVTDLASGAGIAKASVVILGTGFNAVTDDTGNYSIEGVPQGSVTIRFGAVGYTGETMIHALTPYYEGTYDHALQRGQASSLSLAVTTGQQAYPAYAEVNMQSRVENTGSAAVAGTVVLTVLDPDGTYLESFDATVPAADGTTQTVFSFEPGASMTFDFTWNTAGFAPGRYRVLTQVREAAGVSGAALILAASEAHFDIQPTSAIASVRVTPLPGYANVGATEQLGYRVDVVNGSNVPVSSRLAYELRTPASTVAAGGQVALDLQPAESTKSFLLPAAGYVFAASGEYPVSLAVVEGVAPAELVGGKVTVAPDTRIQPSISVSPGVVVPDGDKRIHIDLRLQGVEKK